MAVLQKKKKTRLAILNAAVALFHQKGFHSTTVQEITNHARVAKGTFFNHFPTKESILHALAEERLLLLANSQSIGAGSQPLLTNIRASLLYLLEDYDIHPTLTVLIWKHAAEHEDSLLTHWKQLLEETKEEWVAGAIDHSLLAHIINSHVAYGLHAFRHEPTCIGLVEKIMTLVETSFGTISKRRRPFSMKKLVVLGAGYGGMRLLQRLLPNDLPKDWEIILVDQLPYHCLKTEYYALAAGTASDHHLRVSFPEDERLRIKYATVTAIHLHDSTIDLDNGESIPFDKLVIGLGCTDNFHGVPGADQYTYSIQTMGATRRTYEALNNVRPEGVVSIVGGGLSGVELASELRESRPDLTIRLFDRGDYILSMFPKKLSTYVQNWFVEHGVDVSNNSNITKVEPGAIYNHDERIATDAVIWTAGVQPVDVVRALDVEKDRSGRIVLTPQHFIPDHPDVFVVGDCASLPHAPSAQLAESQAEQIVTILKHQWKGEALPKTLPRIKLKGVLGSLGKKHGFGMMGERPLTGRVPRILKSGVLWMYKYHSG
ncbi:FAD-dependent oxidoreductase [Shouchella clausii]|uniref:FAD-dependent oxidoreductase n=2 Tax=Bacillaceae TaxID=186817 RepID=A0ABZ2CY60_9BACI|nr:MULTISPECIES: FAD-dependent oxidoreductase [Shouchella]ALA54193.1 NADH dehydrogenase [Shouchella clausii]MBU3229260.1 FAD-dependent oxidoreductase [Shouchella clausii]MBU3265518.1 FAD-dependent oxidoreductase [Shouchella clausii]MBU3506160.1 FAD-dependent oxidoreductase [Shouchella clausii]MBU3533983.1 FAD-dependent oxidoreductase [Shouchella clausii]